ncbi:3-methyladenine DNA glycosylase AlkD [Succinivibrio dextrinosolvens]|uniref:DNA alkylation repair protein n=1 Tax=Succinivibrio dextrinosolvens TaxID=83771 RepID=UPI0008EFEA94|nr:DNA alkylation repair protein [Succinivibrio dextrinosolvens]SFS51333.1 3-methyladenine DNA glycosylase AlkD [Succinivibrio dextrinosolvens]
MKKFAWKDLRADLFKIKEDSYREFSEKLSPNVKMLGVRIPQVRKLALSYLKEFPQEELLQSPLPKEPYFEEKLCRAIFIARAKIDENQRITYVNEFLNYLDGWAICDGFCSELKKAKEHQEQYFSFIRKCFKNKSSPYTVRYACVMALMYFCSPLYEDEIISYLDQINTEEYYVHMGVAWLIATLYTKNGPHILDKIKAITLDNLTYNKALQKITESNYICKEKKDEIRKLKRK